MHKYFNLIEIINSIKIDNNNDLREIFDTALNYEFTESETPIEFKEDNIQPWNCCRNSPSIYKGIVQEVQEHDRQE